MALYEIPTVGPDGNYEEYRHLVLGAIQEHLWSPDAWEPEDYEEALQKMRELWVYMANIEVGQGGNGVVTREPKRGLVVYTTLGTNGFTFNVGDNVYPVSSADGFAIASWSAVDFVIAAGRWRVSAYFMGHATDRFQGYLRNKATGNIYRGMPLFNRSVCQPSWFNNAIIDANGVDAYEMACYAQLAGLAGVSLVAGAINIFAQVSIEEVLEGVEPN